MNTNSNLQTTLVSNEHGFDDLDVIGVQYVHRVCVPHDIVIGDYFNVYCVAGLKFGAEWLGSVEKSLHNYSVPPCYLQTILDYKAKQTAAA